MSHAPLNDPLPIRGWKLQVAGFLAVLAASKVGTLMLLTRGTVVCPFWPAGGVELFLMLTYGWRMWPALLAAELAGNLTAGDPGLFAWLAPVTNLGETLTATALIRYFKMDTRLGSVRDIVRFALIAPWVAPVVSAGGGMTLLCLSGIAPWSAWAHDAALWWVANALGLLVVTPALLALAQVQATTPLGRGKDLVYGPLVMTGVIAAGLLGQIWWAELHLFTPVAALFVGIWLGVTGGLAGAASAAAVAMSVYCGATAAGYGYFVRGDAVKESHALAGFGMALAVTLLPLGAVVEELKREKLRTALALHAGRIRLWEWRRESGLHVGDGGLPAPVTKAMEAKLLDAGEVCEVSSPGGTWALRQVRLAGDAQGPIHLVGVAEDITEQRELEQAHLREAVLEARLHSLRSFLNPHLLFNALTGLRATVREEPEAALRYTEDLSRFLRLSLDAGGMPGHTLRDELEVARAFLSFHRHRCDITPEVVWPDKLPSELDATLVPAGLLQSLLENAFKYATPGDDGVVQVVITIGTEAPHHTLRVTHAGEVDKVKATSGKPGGLRYLRDQLALMHGAEAGLSLRESPAGTVVAEVRWPR